VDIGLNGPDDMKELVRIIKVIRFTSNLCDVLPSDPSRLGEPNSDITRLIEDVPDPPVDPRISLLAGLSAANGSLVQIATFVEGLPTTPIVLASLVRTALLGAARVVFSLGPDTHQERLANTLITMRQEAVGLDRLYSTAEKFTALHKLVPPEAVLAEQRKRVNALKKLASLLTETATLERMAEVVGRTLPRREVADDPLRYKEHVAWTFNTYSGVVHGFGWPRLVFGTDSLPGVFIAELGLVAGITHFASDLVVSRSTSPLDSSARE